MKIALTESQIDALNNEKFTTWHRTNDRNKRSYLIDLYNDEDKHVGQINYQQIEPNIGQVESVETFEENKGYGLLLYKKLKEHLEYYNYDKMISDDIIVSHAVYRIWEKMGATWDSENQVYVLNLN